MPGPNTNLEAFLQANAESPSPASPASPEPTPTPEPTPAPTPTPTPEPTPSPEPKEPPKAAAEPETDDDLPEGDIPRQALLDERAKRRDWKGRADRAEAQLAEVRKQLEAAQRPPQAPAPAAPQPQAPQFQFADPNTDPVRWLQEQVINQRFEASETFARQRLGDEAVDQLIKEYQTLANQQGSPLWQQIRQQRDPFRFAEQTVNQHRLLSELGSDPAAYRAKLRAEIEAELRGQMPAQPAAPQNTPAPAQPPSLAGARSVAGRASPAWSGPPSDQQATNDIRAWRMARRAS